MATGEGAAVSDRNGGCWGGASKTAAAVCDRLAMLRAVVYESVTNWPIVGEFRRAPAEFPVFSMGICDLHLCLRSLPRSNLGAQSVATALSGRRGRVFRQTKIQRQSHGAV